MTPDGLYLLSEFISDAEEQHLLDCVDNAPWQTDLKRRVQHYGWRYDYSARRVNPSDYLGALPSWMSQILSKLNALPQVQQQLEQAIVNEYMPGQGIAAHVDCEPCFGPVIASLSLGYGTEMRFEHAEDLRKVTLHLPRKSLLLLTGAARYNWRHGIAARKSDPNPNPKETGRVQRDRRVSITFRSIA